MARTTNNNNQGGKHYAKTRTGSTAKSTKPRSKAPATRSSTPKRNAGSTRTGSTRSSAAPRKTPSRKTPQKKPSASRRSAPRRTPAKHAAPRRRRRRFSFAFRLILLILGIAAIGAVIYLHQAMNSERISSDGFTHAAKYADGLIVDGIDVSYAQADIKDWRKIKRSGVDYVIIRAGYRASQTGEMFEDDYFRDNIKGAQRAGLMVGAYFFSQARNEKEARKEAEYLTELVSKYDIDLPLVLDYETVPGGRLEKALDSGKLDSKKLNKIALAFCSEVESKGYESMVYANMSFLNHRFNSDKLEKKTNIWMAQFNSETSYDGKYLIWQCADDSKVPGIKGHVDKDFMYIDPAKVIRTRGTRNKGAKSLEDCHVELASHSSTYLGANVEPGANVYDGHKELREGTDYRVSYVHNTSAGTGYMIITGLGDYKDQVTMSFMIKGLME